MATSLYKIRIRLAMALMMVMSILLFTSSIAVAYDLGIAAVGQAKAISDFRVAEIEDVHVHRSSGGHERTSHDRTSGHTHSQGISDHSFDCAHFSALSPANAEMKGGSAPVSRDNLFKRDIGSTLERPPKSIVQA